jgi:hypothetical protein
MYHLHTLIHMDFRAVKCCSSLDGIRTHTIDTLQHHSLSLTSSALDHSTTVNGLNIIDRQLTDFLSIYEKNMMYQTAYNDILS